MAAPSTSVLDTFSTGSVLGSNWTTSFGDAAPSVTSGYCVSSGAGWSGAYWNPATFGPDSEVYLTLVAVGPTVQKCILYARITSPGATWNAYGLVVDPGGGTTNWTLQKVTGGSATNLATRTQVVSAGDSIGLVVVGTALQIWFKASGGSWTQLGANFTDSTYTAAGNIGFEVFNTGNHLDDFGGGTVGGTLPGSISVKIAGS